MTSRIVKKINDLVNNFKQAIHGNKISQADSVDQKCVRINTCSKQEGNIYISSETFNGIFCDFLKQIEAEKAYICDSNFHYQLLNALNIIYLDGDWYKTEKLTDSKFSKICSEKAVYDMNLALEEIDRMNIKVDGKFVFIPNSFPISKKSEDNGKKYYKMGYHVFIVCAEDVDDKSRLRIYDNIINNCEDGDKILDDNPLKTKQCLLPFASKLNFNKKSSRVYKLDKKNSQFPQNHFVNDTVQNSTSASMDRIVMEVDDEKPSSLKKLIKQTSEKRKNKKENAVDEEIPVNENPLKENKSTGGKLKHNISSDDYIVFDEYDWRKFGQANKILFTFVRNLIYLNENHQFWKILSDNDDKLKKIMKPMMKMIYVNYVIEKYANVIMHDDLINITVNLLKPLLDRSVEIYPGETNRNTVKSIKQHAETWISKYGGPENMFSKDTSNSEEHETSKLREKISILSVYREFIKNGWTMNSKKYQMWIQENKLYDPITGDIYYYSTNNDEPVWVCDGDKNKYILESDEEFNLIKNNPIGRLRERRLNEFKFICSGTFTSWFSGFVQNIIMSGITTEIIPFSGDDKKKKISFTDAKKNLQRFGKYKSAYYGFIESMCLNFFFATYFNHRQIGNAIAETIAPFIDYYIWPKTKTTRKLNDYDNLWIYNVKQNELLETYPYNQWIYDENGELVLSLISTLYKDFICDLLNEQNKIFGLTVLIDVCNKSLNQFTQTHINKLEIYENPGNDLRSRVLSNIIEKVSRKNITTLVPQCCEYFPMRNGWLKWLKNEQGYLTGEYEFLDNTYTYCMERYTQVPWDEKYDYNCESYKWLNEKINQIYPIPEERDYCLKLFASTLYGCGQKDKFLILYGNGGDGKTTMTNGILHMLNSNHAGSAEIREDGKIINLNCSLPGLGSVMKPEALLSTGPKTTHDEGGALQLDGVRFCTTAEPSKGDFSGNVILDIEEIKKFTGQQTITTRGIFQKAKGIYPNAMIVMQTNTIPRVTENTDGAKRRITLYSHRTKFVTNPDLPENRHVKHCFVADATVNTRITEDPKVWQAFFYILLPYAKSTIQEMNGNQKLSAIKQPQSITSANVNYFEHYTNNVLSALNDVIEYIDQDEVDPNDENSVGIINLNEFVQTMYNYNKNVSEDNSHPSNFLHARKEKDQKEELLTTIKQQYEGNLYRLRKIFYTGKHLDKIQFTAKNIKRDDYDEWNKYSKDLTGLLDAEILTEKAFKKILLRNHTAKYDSAGEYTVKDKYDLYIVGYRYKLKNNNDD